MVHRYTLDFMSVVKAVLIALIAYIGFYINKIYTNYNAAMNLPPFSIVDRCDLVNPQHCANHNILEAEQVWLMDKMDWVEIEGPYQNGYYHRVHELVIETRATNGFHAYHKIPAQRISLTLNTSPQILFQLIRSSGGFALFHPIFNSASFDSPIQSYNWDRGSLHLVKIPGPGDGLVALRAIDNNKMILSIKSAIPPQMIDSQTARPIMTLAVRVSAIAEDRTKVEIFNILTGDFQLLKGFAGYALAVHKNYYAMVDRLLRELNVIQYSIESAKISSKRKRGYDEYWKNYRGGNSKKGFK